MGVALWVAAAVLGLVCARTIPGGGKLWPELLASLATGIAAGLAATALDFGGWRELSWQAFLFALFASFAAAGAVRLVRRLQ